MGKTMKDLDFINNGEIIKLSQKRRKIFISQIENDVNFLYSIGIMDYSLIVYKISYSNGSKMVNFKNSLKVLENHGI